MHCKVKLHYIKLHKTGNNLRKIDSYVLAELYFSLDKQSRISASKHWLE